MPTDDSKLGKLFIETGDGYKEFSKTESISIDSEDVRAPQFLSNKNHAEETEFEIDFDMDKKESQKLHSYLQPEHGRKLTIEKSCICDGTLAFGFQLMQALSRVGATNITLRSEEVENPDPAWMSCRFIATGIVWNTNNFRRMHGIPMKRRKQR